MIARVLPFEEWERLPESLDAILAEMRPGTSRVCVVEENGEIVGRWLLVPTMNAHCLEIAPRKRKTARVGLHLLNLMKDTVRSLGFDQVVTASDSDDVTRLLAHAGAVPLPALHFVMSVKDAR